MRDYVAMPLFPRSFVFSACSEEIFEFGGEDFVFGDFFNRFILQNILCGGQGLWLCPDLWRVWCHRQPAGRERFACAFQGVDGQAQRRGA